LSVFPEGAEYTAFGHENTGYGLWQTLSRATESRGIEVLFDCPAQELIQNPRTKEILGVKVKSEGRDKYIKARKAVALCSGGFEFDFEMLDNYIWAHPCRFTANPGNTGDGIKMAQAVGAALWHMTLIGGGPTAYIPDLGVGAGSMGPSPSISVTKYGKRFMEQRIAINNLTSGGIPAHTSSYALFYWDFEVCDFPAVPFFSIFDQSAVDRGPVTGTSGVLGLKGQYKWSEDNSEEIKKGWILKGDTIEELAMMIDKDPDAAGKMKPEVLADTLAKYNRYCADGVDPEFSNPKTALNPLTKPPYYAMKMYPGTFNTFGGPKRSARGQVVDVFDKPIPRLYSAGELGSILGFLYAGGGWNLCEVIVSGQIAGKHAAAEGSWSQDARLPHG
jgi:succinate dehydrogenase/fumarate reductase flavoprotein subunit